MPLTAPPPPHPFASVWAPWAPCQPRRRVVPAWQRWFSGWFPRRCCCCAGRQCRPGDVATHVVSPSTGAVCPADSAASPAGNGQHGRPTQRKQDMGGAFGGTADTVRKPTYWELHTNTQQLPYTLRVQQTRHDPAVIPNVLPTIAPYPCAALWLAGRRRPPQAATPRLMPLARCVYRRCAELPPSLWSRCPTPWVTACGRSAGWAIED